MNDYNYMLDYYQNMNNYNNLNDFNNNNFLYPNAYPTNEPIKLDSEKGFMRGNMFDDLYDQYKNYIPVEIVSNNNRQALLEKVMQYNFAITDLNLYLDNYPNDANVINIFNNYRNLYLNAVKDFENSYGPLEITDNPVNTNNWVWDKNPWPWEVQN